MVGVLGPRQRNPSLRALVAVLFGAFLGTGCLRLDVTEGGSVVVSPAGHACSRFVPVPPAEPELITQSCHSYPSPAWLDLTATAEPGFEFSRWEGVPWLTCNTSTSCRLWIWSAAHVTAVFEPIIPDYTPDRILVDPGGTVYLLSRGNDTIFRYSLSKERWLASIPLASGAVLIAYSEPLHRLYVAYRDGTITMIDLDQSREEHFFARLSESYRGPDSLTTVGEFTVTFHKPGYWDELTVFDQHGNTLDFARNLRAWSHHFVFDEANHRLLHLQDGLSPNDVVFDPIDPVTGEIGDYGHSPYHGDFPVHGPLVLSPDGTKLLLGSGEILETQTLHHERALPRTFADAAWSDVGLVTLDVTAAGQTRLENWSEDFRVRDVRRLDGEPLRVLEWDGGIHAVTLLEGKPTFHAYHPSDDADRDGSPNEEDAFPLDPAAALDSDGDGFPDAWNRLWGRLITSNDLMLDAFPFDSACQLPEHGADGRCDIEASIPDYTPDQIVADDDVIYLLSSPDARVFRWSIREGRHLNPIVTREEPTDLALSVASGRLYLGYPDGEITQVDVEQPFRSEAFGAVSHFPVALATAGATVVAAEKPTNWHRAVGFDPLGNATSWVENVYEPRGGLIWAPAISRLYSGNYSSWVEVDTESHRVHSGRHFSIYPPEPLTPLLRISLDASIALQGPRFFYDTTTRQMIGEIPHAVVDGTWRPDGTVTLTEVGPEATRLEQWGMAFELFDSRELPGSPLRVLQWSGGVVAVTLAEGRPIFTTHVPTDDADGDGILNLDDDFTIDPAASVDSDGDGQPNHWNPGRDASDSTTGLQIDAFPDDPECWAPEHEHKGVCDIARRLPAYEPDRVVEDDSGIVYLLSGEQQRLFRWSWEEQYHLEPIEIGADANDVAYLGETDRLYIAYQNGSINQLEPGESPVEQPFASDLERVFHLAPAGRFLVASGAIGNRSHLGVYATDGTMAHDFAYAYPRESDWSERLERVYARGRYNVLSQEIDQDTGEYGAVVTAPRHAGFSPWGPIRVSPDGSRVLIGTGNIYDALTLERIALLPSWAFDAVWLEEGLVSILENEAGNTVLRRWDGDLRLVATVTYPGTPIRVLKRNERILVITSRENQPAFHIYELTDDHDDDGVPFVDDAFPMDPAASSDADGDGYPEAWNPGKDGSDSTTGLALDAFPDEFACFLAEHEVAGGCDFALLFPKDRDSPICEVDNPPEGTMQGRLWLGPTAAYLPLCSGWIAHSDVWSNRVVIQNVFDARLGTVFPLAGAPGELALDDDGHILFATLPDEHAVAMIDLVTSEVQVVPVPERADEIAVGRDGELFIVTDKDRFGTLYHLPAGAATVEGGWEIDGVMIEYNAARDELVASDRYWPDLARYSFDPSTGPTLIQIRSTARNAKELAVSPDGEHIAQASGAGHGTGYNVWDFAGGDLETVYGEWDTGAYPQAAAFDPTSTLFLSTQGGQFLIYDVETHTELVRQTMIHCLYSDVSRAGFSRGGRIATIQQTCGYLDESASVQFLVLDEP
jgi:DNA-binding beta-propeller fold protein YncE